MTPSQVKWYWLDSDVALKLFGHHRGGWVHAGPCTLVMRLEGLERALRKCAPDGKPLWEPGYGAHSSQNEASGEVCLACKRWEPPDEPA